NNTQARLTTPRDSLIFIRTARGIRSQDTETAGVHTESDSAGRRLERAAGTTIHLWAALHSSAISRGGGCRITLADGCLIHSTAGSGRPAPSSMADQATSTPYGTRPTSCLYAHGRDL